MSKSEEKEAISKLTTSSEDKEAISKLTKSVVHQFEGNLIQAQKHLKELTDTQENLIASVKAENAKYNDTINTIDVESMLSRTKMYYQKLLSIRKDMTNLS